MKFNLSFCIFTEEIIVATKLKFCDCKSTFQDSEYAGKRVHNKTRKKEGSIYRCTVCGKERD